jgi:hypothetical protein
MENWDKKQNIKYDFKCRLANKKKPRCFIERWKKIKKIKQTSL